MDSSVAATVIGRRYRQTFGTIPPLVYREYLATGRIPDSLAALGFRRASDGELFLERYLDDPIERVATAALNCDVDRSAIVEIGNFAADNAIVMLELWASAANDLAGSSELAVATLTAPLRRIFARIGIPVSVLGAARAAADSPDAHRWGSYYEQDPQVCAGWITAGQEALAGWRGSRPSARK
jgi:hypothetical protein